MSEVWMISNRQPWVEALLCGLISCKTRSAGVHLPPCRALVYLHASKALWRGWRNLWWVEAHGIDVPELPRGGVVGVATLIAKGPTEVMMSVEDAEYFSFEPWDDCDRRRLFYGLSMSSIVAAWGCCAGEQTMRFENVRRTPFIACRGAQVPTRKLPPELRAWHEANFAE